MGVPQVSSFACHIGASSSLSSPTMWGSPQISFFSYNMGSPLRSVSLHAIEGEGGGAPQIRFFTKYMGPLRSVSPLTIWSPLRLVSSLTIRGPSDQFLCILLGAPLRSVFSLTIWGPLRSVSSHTIWGAPQISFFAYYMAVPWDKFLCLLYEGPPQISFFAYYMGSSLRSVSSHTI